MSNKPFDKFINKVEQGAKKKERIRQEKRQLRAEKNAYFEEKKKLARERNSESREQGEKNRMQGTDAFKKGNNRWQGGRQKAGGKKYEEPGKGIRKEEIGRRGEAEKNVARQRTPSRIRKAGSKQPPSAESSGSPGKDGIQTAQMSLNKYIAWSGVCGRREAADLIKGGKVTVNNQVVTNPPFRVGPTDSIKVNGKKISIQKNLVYILLNKPKDYITTLDDPEGRKTVMDLVKRATTERIFPVGRLDRNTTGVLLLTNDGDLAQRLTHPKYEVKKIYEVRVDKPVTKQTLDTIAKGIQLEDGFIRPDAVSYADVKDKSVIGIEIHSGRNRIVRRIFEHLGFKIKNLDRVMYGIFTKKNVERGKWRLLTEKEIRILKHLNTSLGQKKPS